MSKSKLNLPSPIQKVQNHELPIDLFVKREDLIHPIIKGNKYRKLKYNIDAMKSKTVISFGGAYSNHLHALAGLCFEENIKCIGIVRGEKVENHVLSFCEDHGMTLHFIDRSSYREKEESVIVKDIISNYSNPFIIPEGGSNYLALKGVAELVDEIKNTGETYDFIAVAAGTGCTAAGILQGIKKHHLASKLLIFSALKGDWMKDEIIKFSAINDVDFFCTDEFSLGGYAKVNQEYLDFKNEFSKKVDIPIDDIYNGKLLYGIKQLCERHFFEPNAKVLWINSGGVNQ